MKNANPRSQKIPYETDWGRMDSHTEPDGSFVFGPNDLDLAMRLAKAGSDHRKYLRMVFVSVDVTAPLYWWKEYDTYKVATVANSTSTMHKIHSKPFSMDDFSCDHMTDGTKNLWKQLLPSLKTSVFVLRRQNQRMTGMI